MKAARVRPMPLPLRLFAAAVLLHPAAIAAQHAPNDSARVARAARDAQRDFEWHRRANLPWAGGGSGGRCDAHVGRFCYWHGVTPDTAPPERPTIARARLRMLAQLDSAASRIPGDGWIAGQRVRYRLEAGSPVAALAAADACAAAAWWCDALRGLALHVASRYTEAESAFDRALSEMPDSVRCRWTDLTPLLDGVAADRYRALGCAERAPFDARLWWLAQPFYSLGANDRRTEHFARRTIARLARESVWPVAASWDDDVRDLILRYGWPRWFERVRPVSDADPNYSVMGHDPQPSFAFFPAARLLDAAYSARPADWDPGADHAASRYAPAYAIALAPIAVLVSRFVRGDSAVVVAAYDASTDRAFANGTVRAALVIAPDERQRYTTIVPRAPRAGALAVVAPRLPAIASVELLDTVARAAGRWRSALALAPATPAATLSDVLLFRPDGPLPETLADAARTAVAAVEAGGRPLGLYWEWYGMAAGTPVDVTLTVQRTGAGWWQRTRRFLHLGGSAAPVALRWRDVVQPRNGVAGRAVSVDLSRLDGGAYLLRLEVTGADGTRATAERRLDVRR